MAITLYLVKIASPSLRREYELRCLNEYGFPGFSHRDRGEGVHCNEDGEYDDDYLEFQEKSRAQKDDNKKKEKKRLAWYQPNFKCVDGCCFKDIEERQDYRLDLKEIIRLAKVKNIIVQKCHPSPGERDLDIEDRRELRRKEEPFKKEILNMSYSPKHAHAKTNIEKLS